MVLSDPAAAGVTDRTARGRTDRGQKTREALVIAARKVLEQRGFPATRVADITRLARVAHGTFYTYFDSKEDVFRDVARRMQADLTVVRSNAPAVDRTPSARIGRANRAYFDFYKRNATMMGILEQVATFNAEFAAFRREMRAEAASRSARAIRSWQSEGLVSPELNPDYTASALGSMVDRSCYVWLVLGEPFEEEQALGTLDLLCVQALGLDHQRRARR
jgi:AcrR family transcriptional regulator